MGKSSRLTKTGAAPASVPADGGLLLALFISGFAALGYEILWTRLLALFLGSEVLAVLGVLAGFFGGMAAGAFLLNDHAHRCAHPARVFLAIELWVAAYAVASPHLWPLLAPGMGKIQGGAGGSAGLWSLWAVHLTAAAVLLPGTIGLGASWAYAVAARRQVRRGHPEVEHVSRLYFANTFGAAAGVLTSVYLILPRAGLAWGAAVLAAFGVTAALLAWAWQGRSVPAPLEPALLVRTSKRAKPRRDPVAPLSQTHLYILLVLSGVAGVGVEFAFIHLLSQLFQNTIYTFANLLAVYLLGTAAGAWWAQRPGSAVALSRLFWWLALAVVFSTFLLWFAPLIFAVLRPPGAGLGRNLLGELILSSLVFLPSTLLMGALFSRLIGALPPQTTGRGYGWNTLGAALAPLFLGLVILRWGGSGALLSSVVLLYLAGWLGCQPVRRLPQLAALGVVLAVQVWAAGGIQLIALPPGWRTLSARDTLYGEVIVSEEHGARGIWGQPLRRLQVNNQFWMGGGQGFAEMRLGHLAMLLQPDARRLLYLGSSTGVSLGAARDYPFTRIDAVEIVPRIVEEMHWFKDINFDVQHDPRVRMIQADARRFVAGAPEPYDLIISDLFHPGLDGAGSLYTLEHFQNIAQHLTDDGVAVQAVALYQFEPAVLQSLVRTFLEAFPEAHGFLAVYNVESPILLLAGKKAGHPLRFDLGWVRQHLGAGNRAAQVIQNIPDFLGAYLCDRDGLAAFCAPGPINSDFSPFILFHAPRQNYLQAPEGRFQSLESLARYACPPSFALVEGAPLPPSREEYVALLRTWQSAQDLMEAKLALARGPAETALPVALNLLKGASLRAPDFGAVRGELRRLAEESPREREEILRHLDALGSRPAPGKPAP